MKLLFPFFLILLSCSLTAQSTDERGRKQGYWKKKDEKTHKVVYEGMFKDDVPSGKFKYYYPNDSVRAIMDFKQGGKTAYAKLFHPNGKRMAEGKYVNKEIKDSAWTYYDEAGVLISKDFYTMGKKNGACYIYFPDGNVAEERNYKMDLQDGLFKVYFDASNLKTKGNYAKDKLEGRIAYYYPNGVEVAAGYYKNGEKNGPWIYKTESGKIREKELYKNGKLASEKETQEFFSKHQALEDKAPKKQKPSSSSAGKKNTVKKP